MIAPSSEVLGVPCTMGALSLSILARLPRTRHWVRTVRVQAAVALDWAGRYSMMGAFLWPTAQSREIRLLEVRAAAQLMPKDVEEAHLMTGSVRGLTLAKEETGGLFMKFLTVRHVIRLALEATGGLGQAGAVDG